MVVFGGHLDWVIVIFLVLVFAEYTKVRAKSAKGFGLIGGAAVFFLLAGSFAVPGGLGFMGLLTTSGLAAVGQYLFEVIGFIFLLIGTILVAIDWTK